MKNFLLLIHFRLNWFAMLVVFTLASSFHPKADAADYHIGLTDQEAVRFGIEDYSKKSDIQMKWRTKTDQLMGGIDRVLSWAPTVAQLAIIYYSKELTKGGIKKFNQGVEKYKDYLPVKEGGDAVNYWKVGPVEFDRFFPALAVSVPVWFIAKTLVPVGSSIQRGIISRVYRTFTPINEAQLSHVSETVREERAQDTCEALGNFSPVDTPSSFVLGSLRVTKEMVESGDNRFYLNGKQVNWQDLHLEDNQTETTLYPFQTMRCLTSRHEETFLSDLL